MSGLALQIPIEDLLIPPSAYLTDRQKVPDIFAPYASGKRAFGVRTPLPMSADGQVRLPRVLREATSFVLTDPLVKTEGIFRVSARAQTVEVLKEAFERAQKFIVWREANTVLTFPHFKEGKGLVSIPEPDPLDGYDVHTAAALIKLWYHDLREPIVPSTSYQALEKFHGGSQIPDQEQLFQLLSPESDTFSPLPPLSRQILTIHLLPLLSRIADHSDWNRMAPSNLATVFAPNLVCGPDPIADLKMIGIIQRLLKAMISNWKPIAPVLDCSDEAFDTLLRLPENIADREDSLQEVRQGDKANPFPGQLNGIAQQTAGISLQDNDCASDGSIDEDDLIDQDGQRPPLPPRPNPANTSTEDLSSPNAIRRKPAPVVAPLPRYSTVFGSRPNMPILDLLDPQTASSGEHDVAATVAALTGSNRDTIIEDNEPLPTYESVTPSHPGQIPPVLDTFAGEFRRETVTGVDFSTLADSPGGSLQRKPVGGEKSGEKSHS